MIYFIESGKGGPIKIGVTWNIQLRLDELQVGNPCKLNLLWIYNGRQFTELELHAKFKSDRIRGEWYNRTEAILSLKDKYPNDCFQPTPLGLYKCIDSVYWINYERASSEEEE